MSTTEFPENVTEIMCENSTYGCCQDDRTPALGADFLGCLCSKSQFGCCPDGKKLFKKQMLNRNSLDLIVLQKQLTKSDLLFLYKTITLFPFGYLPACR